MRRSAFVLSVMFAAALPALPASIEIAKPEQTGFSSERLARIHDMVQRHIDDHDISGAVTLVARNGRVVHFEAHGLANLDAKRPMSKDSLFWIMSMTKPVVGTAVLMMMEEGKLRLTDPISRFIPEFKGMKVAVIEERPAGTRGPAPAPGTPPAFYTIPAAREITVQDLLTRLGSQQRRTSQHRGSGQDRAPSRGEPGRLHPAPRHDPARFSTRHALAV